MSPIQFRNPKEVALGMLALVAVSAALVVAGITLAAEINNAEPFDYQPLDPGNEAFLIEDAGELENLFVRRDLRYRHSELEAMLARIAGRISPPATDDYIDYRFYLVRDPSPVSFSLVDGQVYLHSGLLARLENEAQVAAVLAHEIHHVAAHHHIDADRSRRSKETGTQVAATVVDFFVPLGGALSWTSNYFAMNAKMKFDLDYEMAADRHALNLMASAGYSPHSAPRVLELMIEDAEFRSPRLIGSWTTNEELHERKNKLEALTEHLIADGDEQNPELAAEFLRLKRPLIELTIDDYIRVDSPRTAIAFVDDLLSASPSASLHAAMGDALYALGPRPNVAPEEISNKEMRRLKRMTRDEIIAEIMATDEGQANYQSHLEMAQQSYRTALELNPDAVRAHRGLGDLLFEKADYRASARHYIRYLKLSPDAVDKSIVMEKLQQIRSHLQHEKENG